MSKILVLGGTGSLGSHIVEQAVETHHHVTVSARHVSNLPAGFRGKVEVVELDVLATAPPELASFFQGFEVVINAAGNVAQGQPFVDLVDRVVAGLELVPPGARPVSWFLAGLALLDLDPSGLKGLDLPQLFQTYWPHRLNYDRLRQTTLDWRLFCPGPMTNERPRGISGMRVSLDRLPVEAPENLASLPERDVLRVFSDLLPQMVIPYKDAAELILAHLTPEEGLSRHRVGLALPAGRPYP